MNYKLNWILLKGLWILYLFKIKGYFWSRLLTSFSSGPTDPESVSSSLKLSSQYWSTSIFLKAELKVFLAIAVFWTIRDKESWNDPPKGKVMNHLELSLLSTGSFFFESVNFYRQYLLCKLNYKKNYQFFNIWLLLGRV